MKVFTCETEVSTREMELSTCVTEVFIRETEVSTCEMEVSTREMEVFTCVMVLFTCEMKVSAREMEVFTCVTVLFRCETEAFTCEMKFFTRTTVLFGSAVMKSVHLNPAYCFQTPIRNPPFFIPHPFGRTHPLPRAVLTLIPPPSPLFFHPSSLILHPFQYPVAVRSISYLKSVVR